MSLLLSERQKRHDPAQLRCGPAAFAALNLPSPRPWRGSRSGAHGRLPPSFATRGRRQRSCAAALTPPPLGFTKLFLLTGVFSALAIRSAFDGARVCTEARCADSDCGNPSRYMRSGD
jgi:hypothetical protein